MKIQILATIITTLFSHVLGFPHLANFPKHPPLAGLSPGEIRAASQQINSMPGPQPLPAPISDTSSKLVNDAAHPFVPDQPGDIRGPCPGLNTLASHGYISRTGVTTPGEIITAVQEGFNMGWQFASFLTYSVFITDGDHMANSISIGRNTTTKGQLITGMDTHGYFEGDASLSRQDAFLGNNFDFDEGLFDALKVAADQVGGGVINLDAAVLNRVMRINDSIKRNPKFSFGNPRFLSAMAETGFLLAMFVNNQTTDNTKPLTLEDARSFFESHRFPNQFFRRQDSFEFPVVDIFAHQIMRMVGRQPGSNNGVNNYVVDPQDPPTWCNIYEKQVKLTAMLYPNPAPQLKEAIKSNLNTYYQTVGDSACQQVFPYGQ